MATETATIRVPREVRDRLAQQAEARGVSMASLLADFAWRNDLEVVYREERAAAQIDNSNPDALREQEDWESADGDGL